MERIEKDCGYLILQDGKIYDCKGGNTDNGVVYKDYEAFKSGKGICYISEYGLKELEDKLADLERAHYDSPITSERLYLSERERIILSAGETRQSIIEQVRKAFGDDYMMTDEQVAYFAEDVFGLADWACIATYLAENFEIDDCIQYDYEHGGTMFTYFQYEAVMNDMTPKEFADRQLSYGELFELDNEFDTAFIVDEDCEDDWSDKGLGANARITYIEERRTGMIDGPEQFDCPPQFVRK
jgi:hypothetical protein